MLTVPELPPFRDHPDTGDVHVPSVQVVALGERREDTRLGRIGVDDFDFGEPYPLLKTRGSRDTRHHHQLDQLLGLVSELSPLGLFQAVLRGRDVFVCKALQELGCVSLSQSTKKQ